MEQKEKIRILQVVSSLKKNGTETFLMNVFRQINREKYSFDFLVFNDDKDGYYEEAVSLGAKIFYIPPRRHNPLQFHRNLEKFFIDHQNEYDVVHMNDMSMTTLAPLRLAKKYKIPLRIIHMHGAHCQGVHNKVFHLINKQRISKVANNYLGCSKDAIKWGFNGTSALKSAKVVTNGIELSKFEFNKEDRSIIRKELGIQETDFTIVNVGAFNTIKNQKFLVEIIKKLKEKKHPVKLILIGQGILLESVKNLSKSLGIENDVLMLGHKDHVGPYLSASDLMVFPSLREGLGLVAVEAQANGLPIIVSTGVPEEVGVSDYFFRYNLKKGIEFWANKIEELFTLKNVRIQSSGIKNYNISRTIEQLCKIYDFKGKEM